MENSNEVTFAVCDAVYGVDAVHIIQATGREGGSESVVQTDRQTCRMEEGEREGGEEEGEKSTYTRCCFTAHVGRALKDITAEEEDRNPNRNGGGDGTNVHITKEKRMTRNEKFDETLIPGATWLCTSRADNGAMNVMHSTDTPCNPTWLGSEAPRTATGLKERLARRWRAITTTTTNGGGGGGGGGDNNNDKTGSTSSNGDFANALQSRIFHLLASYRDVFVPCRPLPRRAAPENPRDNGSDDLCDAYLLHCMNHVLKSMDAMRKNSDKKRAAIEAANKTKNYAAVAQSSKQKTTHSTTTAALGDVPNDDEMGLRDQGFVRPKCLLLMPLRSCAARAVGRMAQMCPSVPDVDAVLNLHRFIREYCLNDDTDDDDDDDDDDNEDEDDDEDEHKDIDDGSTGGQEKRKRKKSATTTMKDRAKSKKRKKKKPRKPAEHVRLFSGNKDDDFVLGIKMTRGSMQLYAPLLASDIIVASPLGLVTAMARDGSTTRDALTSIEVVVLEHADVMAMQNWEHVMTVMLALNAMPTEQHGTDFSRVREYFLSGDAAQYRQTVLLSATHDPQMQALFRRLCNHQGSAVLRPDYHGVQHCVADGRATQVWRRLDAMSPEDEADARFALFESEVLPKLARDDDGKNDEQGGDENGRRSKTSAGGILIFVPSYLDFVRVRNYCAKRNLSFVGVSEYSKFADVTRSRSRFYARQRRIMLYTERAHFFNRFRIGGVRHVVFYGVPSYAHFFPELVNLIDNDSGGGSSSSSSGTKKRSLLADKNSDTGKRQVTVLFSRFDLPRLERVVGRSRARRLVHTDDKKVFIIK